MTSSKNTNRSEQSILVTGGAGFVGKNTVKLLLECGYSKITVIDNFSNSARDSLDFAKDKLTIFENDITDFNSIKEIFSTNKFTQVLHLAACTSVEESVKNPVGSRQNNISGFHNILELSRLFEVKSFVYASSAAVYGFSQELPLSENLELIPQSPYGFEKLVNEQYAALYDRLYGFKSVGLRYFNIYGYGQNPTSPYSGVITKFVDSAKSNINFKIYGSGNQTRDFIHVTDIARANLLALELYPAEPIVTNVCTGSETTLLELIEIITSNIKCDCKTDFLPEKIGDIKHSVGNNTKALDLLSFSSSVKIQEGIGTILTLLPRELLQKNV